MRTPIAPGGGPAVRTVASLFLVFSILCTAHGAALRAGEIRVLYRFDPPAIERTAGGEFSRLHFSGTMQAGRPGEPGYPFRGVRILLPPGEIASGVRLERRLRREIPGRHTLHPVQLSVPASLHSAESGQPAPAHGAGDQGGFNYPDDSAPAEGEQGRFEYPDGSAPERRPDGLLIHGAAYDADRWVHPPAPEPTTHYLRGHAIATGSFSPVVFHPASRRAGYYEEVEIVVETEPGAEAHEALALLRDDPDTRRRIERLVDNPEAASLYGSRTAAAYPAQGGGDTYEYLIITRDSLASAFGPLADFHNRRGLRTAIMTVEDIEASAAGADTPEKIRNAILGEYLNHGVGYVLLGGDGDGPPGVPKVVPYRGFYCGVESSVFYEDDNIPADMYFSHLDGTWNDDADSLWAEPGEEDFYAEVAVGRACVDTPAEVANFIEKTTTYQESPIPGQMRTALLLGEKLWSDPLTWGGDEMDQLVDTCMSYGFTTKGIPLDYTITKYYDRDIGGWSALALMAKVNEGTNWLFHAGHCNLYYAMRLHYEDVTDTNFTNDGASAIYTLVYTYGCYVGAFDNRSTSTYYDLDCIAEKMMELDHFAAALLVNSRYGWLTEGTTNGPSHHFQREFADAIFTEGYHTLGAANERSKDETAPFIDPPGEYESGAHRWCFYTLNLLGDPALDAWTEDPGTLAPLYPREIARGDSIVEIDAGFPGTAASLYLDGVCFGRGVADDLGRIELPLSIPIPDTVSKVELNLCAHDRYPFRDSILVVEATGSTIPPPPVVLEQNTPNPFNPATIIRFTIPAGGYVDLRVYNVAGQEVDRLLSHHLDAGAHSVVWSPPHLASGLYLYVLRAGGDRIVRKAVLLR